MTSSQIDRLGDRLKLPELAEADLRALDDYRRSFALAYAAVLDRIRESVGLQPTGRVAKSTASIVDKLRRESIRLSQMQDIAGCRLVVADIPAQDQTIEALGSVFAHTTVVDRRAHPSHGYRAVHVIVKSDNKLVEIQVRTKSQHLWAEISEKLADEMDPALKYGGGPNSLQTTLQQLSAEVAKHEVGERELSRARILLSGAPSNDEFQHQVEEMSQLLATETETFRKSMQHFLESLPLLLGQVRKP